MTLPALRAALERVEASIAACTCSALMGDLLRQRANVKAQIATQRGKA